MIRAIQVARENRALRRRLTVCSQAGDVIAAPVDTVACTIGILCPRVVVNLWQLAQLADSEQRAVLEHERGHARGLHGLIDLVAQSLAAGVAPLPTARHAMTDVRRQLEAAADDAAARRTGRRTVAGAIVAAACSPPPRGALGTSGWALWRVDRLLRRPPRGERGALVASGVLVLAGLLAGHSVLHSVNLLSGWRLAVLAEVCCTI